MKLSERILKYGLLTLNPIEIYAAIQALENKVDQAECEINVQLLACANAERDVQFYKQQYDSVKKLSE